MSQLENQPPSSSQDNLNLPRELTAELAETLQAQRKFEQSRESLRECFLEKPDPEELPFFGNTEKEGLRLETQHELHQPLDFIKQEDWANTEAGDQVSEEAESQELSSTSGARIGRESSHSVRSDRPLNITTGSSFA